MPTHYHDSPDEQQEPKQIQQEALPDDPYAVLELDPTADSDAIKRAYFQKVREHPPEKDPQQFKRIRAAYDALRTPEARATTDLLRLHPPPPYETYKRPPKLQTDYSEEDRETMLRAQSDLVRTDFSKDFRNVDL